MGGWDLGVDRVEIEYFQSKFCGPRFSSGIFLGAEGGSGSGRGLKPDVRHTARLRRLLRDPVAGTKCTEVDRAVPRLVCPLIR